MSYILQHTAKAIDDKLNLIDKNKNLLVYPYNEFHVNSLDFDHLSYLADIGDGSILTTQDYNSEDGTCRGVKLVDNMELLPGKKYLFGLEVVDATDKLISNPGFDLELVETSASPDVLSNKSELIQDSFANMCYVLDLSTVTTEEFSFTVVLSCPANFSSGLIIRPQIEEVQVDEGGNEILEKTSWVPYMKTIGTYVDERFNSTNAKIKILKDASVTTKIYTVAVNSDNIINTSMDPSTGYRTMTIGVSGIKESDNPTADILLSSNSTAESDLKAINEWSKITRITTDNDSITLYYPIKDDDFLDINGTKLDIQLKVVR